MSSARSGAVVDNAPSAVDTPAALRTSIRLRREAPSVLLVIPPFTHPNAPHAAVPALAGFLQSRGFRVHQDDAGLGVLRSLFTPGTLGRLFSEIRSAGRAWPEPVVRMLSLERHYVAAVGPVIAFLEGRDETAAARICGGSFLPRGPRLEAAGGDARPFGPLAIVERARRLATLYLEDLADLIRATVAPGFGLARYGEDLARSAVLFDPIASALDGPPNPIDRLIVDRARRLVEDRDLTLVGITAPFPGTLLGALRVAQGIKSVSPALPVVLGGGYVSTELRDLREPRLFDAVDYVVLDAGERPLLCIMERLAGRREERRLCRTFVRRRGRVVFRDGAGEPDFGPEETGFPTVRDLPKRGYLSLLETPNPMLRLWSEGRWNRLQVAHGCYWRRCAFCDTRLDCIRRYAPVPTDLLVRRIAGLCMETMQTGFHFVDEAAPPAALEALAIALLEERLEITWWTNIRLEESFSPDLCRLLAASGCIAVTAGLEAADDRLLRLMDKGITVDGAIRVAAAFADAGVMVHLYLMHGFPTQTARETVEALERVRQIFAAGIAQSAFWHRFVLTANSRIAADPAAWGVSIRRRRRRAFASNDLEHVDPAGCDPARFSDGLDRATHAYMPGIGLDRDVRSWFDRGAPAPRVPRDLVARALAARPAPDDGRARGRLVWLGGEPRVERTGGRWRLVLELPTGTVSVPVSGGAARWLADVLVAATPRRRAGRSPNYPEAADLRSSYPSSNRPTFDEFLRGRAWRTVRRAGLLVV